MSAIHNDYFWNISTLNLMVRKKKKNNLRNILFVALGYYPLSLSRCFLWGTSSGNSPLEPRKYEDWDCPIIPYSSKCYIHKFLCFSLPLNFSLSDREVKSHHHFITVYKWLFVKNGVSYWFYVPLIYWQLPSKYIKRYMHSLRCQSEHCGMKRIFQIFLLDNTVRNA